MSLVAKLRRIKNCVSSWKNFLKKEYNSDNEIPLRKKIYILLKGYSSSMYHLYDLKNNALTDYLNEFALDKAAKINVLGRDLFNDKLMFSLILSRYLKVPKILAAIDQGKLIHYDEHLNIEKLLEINLKLIVKPRNGYGGRSVYLIEFENGNLSINSKPVTLNQVEKMLTNLDNYIVSEFIEQCNFHNNLYAKTVNTIRIMTMIDPYELQPFIPFAVQRIGNNNSFPTDNVARGGLFSPIDIDTGTLGPARRDSIFKENGKLYYHHPETGNQISGLQIPQWNEIMGVVLKVVRELPFIKYLGWDIILMNNDICVLEGNLYPSLDIYQANSPILKDPRIKNFYRYYKVI